MVRAGKELKGFNPHPVAEIFEAQNEKTEKKNLVAKLRAIVAIQMLYIRRQKFLARRASIDSAKEKTHKQEYQCTEVKVTTGEGKKDKFDENISMLFQSRDSVEAYLQRKKILQLLKNIFSHVLYEKPLDPWQRLIQVLENIQSITRDNINATNNRIDNDITNNNKRTNVNKHNNRNGDQQNSSNDNNGKNDDDDDNNSHKCSNDSKAIQNDDDKKHYLMNGAENKNNEKTSATQNYGIFNERDFHNFFSILDKDDDGKIPIADAIRAVRKYPLSTHYLDILKKKKLFELKEIGIQDFVTSIKELVETYYNTST